MNNRIGSVLLRDIQSPLGDMVAGTTENGICYLDWPDDDGLEMVAAKIGKRYGVSPEFQTHAHTRQLEAELAEYFSGERRRFKVPLDTRGTDFEKQVWRHLTSIAYGRTRSYGEVARAIGRPDAARDVGAALARNPYPILVPCHRIVAANGALTGFSAPGGLATKRRMLELEGAPGYGQQTLFG